MSEQYMYKTVVCKHCGGYWIVTPNQCTCIHCGSDDCREALIVDDKVQK